MIIQGTRFLKPRKYLLSTSRLIEKDSEGLSGRRWFVTAADFINAYKSRAGGVALKALLSGSIQEEYYWKYMPFNISRRQIGCAKFDKKTFALIKRTFGVK